MSSDERFDSLFMTVAQQAQGIEPLLDQLFGFLRRKTDFYTAPPDKIHSMVMGALKKQGEVYDQDQAKKAAAREKEEKRKKVAAALKKKKEEDAAGAKAAAAPPVAPAAPAASDDGVLELSGDGSFDTTATEDEPPVPPVRSSSTADASATTTGPGLPDDAEAQVASAEAAEEEDNTPAPEGNGGSTDKYVWTQTLAEVAVTIPLPAGTKAKMLVVDIGNTSVKVALKGSGEVLVQGTFHKRVHLDDTLWAIDDGNLVLDICKDNKVEWWKCVLAGDPEINTQKVQPENSKLGDLDGETRQTVEKMMFDQRQKAQGLPSSEELQKQNMMKKFMDSHPEMDFSKAKFN